MLPSSTGVLVVGAGPVGLAAAAALRYRGIDVTVIDGQAAGSHSSRAAVVHPRTLEALDEIGVPEPLAGRSLQLGTFTIRDRDRVLMPLRFDRMPSRYRTIYMVPQSTTEEVISERLTALGGRVLRPHVLTGLAQDADGVTATVDGAHQIRADYLIGADGMRSTVREAAGIGFGSDRGGQSFTLADVTVDRGLPADEVGLFFSPGGMLVCAPLPGGVFRLVAEVLQAPEQPDVAGVQRLLDERGPSGSPATVTGLLWGSRFRIHHRVAERFREGRVLLAGDAAHVHSPAGGQGMNLGLRDAIALADALGHVYRGTGDAVLDEYAAARRSQAVQVVRLAQRLTRLATVGPGGRQIRNAAVRAAAMVPGIRFGLAKRLAGLADR